MKEAKKRGDLGEVMRLAAEAQQTDARASKAADPTPAYQKQAWQLHESAYAELLAAAYWSRIYVSNLCICAARCRLPIGEGAHRD
jgi:hypothetical protein